MSDKYSLMEAIDDIDDSYLKKYFEMKEQYAGKKKSPAKKEVMKWGAIAASVVVIAACTIPIVLHDPTPPADIGDGQVELPNENVDQKLFDTYLYSTAEDNYILNEQRCTNFDTREYTDSKVQQKKSLTIHGLEYTMTYEKSAILPMSDLAVHTYKIDGLENARVLVNAANGAVVKYMNIPYTEILSSEKDYLDFIQSLHVSSNYSTYNYRCMTHCYYISDSEMRSSMENGFLLENENRTTKAYYFFFTQPIGSIETDNHVSAVFNSDTFTLEVYDIEYTTDVFQPLLASLSKLDNELTEYVKANLKKDFTISNCNIGKQTLFIKDGTPYIVTSVSVTFTQNDVQDSSQYTTNLQIISGMKK